MRTYSIGVGAIFALLFSVSLARADDVPVLQVEQVCHGIVDQSGGSLTVGDPKVAFDQCMAGEKNDRDKMEIGSVNADVHDALREKGQHQLQQAPGEEPGDQLEQQPLIREKIPKGRSHRWFSK